MRLFFVCLVVGNSTDLSTEAAYTCFWIAFKNLFLVKSIEKKCTAFLFERQLWQQNHPFLPCTSSNLLQFIFYLNTYTILSNDFSFGLFCRFSLCRCDCCTEREKSKRSCSPSKRMRASSKLTEKKSVAKRPPPSHPKYHYYSHFDGYFYLAQTFVDC